MDQIVFTAIRGDIISNDVQRQTSAVLVALQMAAGGKDISCLSTALSADLAASPANAVTKQLAHDALRSTHLTHDDWDIVCRGLKHDFSCPDPDVIAAAIRFLPALPGWRIPPFLLDHAKIITNCIVHEHENLRTAAVEGMATLLVRDDIIAAATSSSAFLEQMVHWWRMLAASALDPCDAVAGAAFAALGQLFAELRSRTMSRAAAQRLVPEEAAEAVRAQLVIALASRVWVQRSLLLARAALLPPQFVRTAIFPLAYAARAVASGLIDALLSLLVPERGPLDAAQADAAAAAQEAKRAAHSNGPGSRRKSSSQEGGEDGTGAKRRSTSTPAGGGEGPDGAGSETDLVNAERMLGVAEVVGFLTPYLSSLDPSLVFEAGSHMLSLAAVRGGKPEWAAAPITAFLSLWDRAEFSAGREAIVQAVVRHLQLLDVHTQVALFRRLLLMVRNLRVEADRMRALACICRAALVVDLFAKESAHRGQRPVPGSDIGVSLFSDPQVREEFSAVALGSDGLFREELLACVVESTFALATRSGGGGSGAGVGPTAGGLGAADAMLGAAEGPAAAPSSSALAAQWGLQEGGPLERLVGEETLAGGWRVWALTAMEVLEVCRPCVRWDGGGRTYAVDCYLRLLVRLCQVHDTAGGVKSVRDGATPQQVRSEQRLQTLHKHLLADLKELPSPLIRARLLWVLCEHVWFPLQDPIQQSDPSDPLTVLVASLHRVLFGSDPSSAALLPSLESASGDRLRPSAHLATWHRLQEVQAVLVAALHLGARSFRAASVVAREVEELRCRAESSACTRHHCRSVLQTLAYVQLNQGKSWLARVGTTGEYPFSHHRLSVLYNDAAGAQDRKLAALVSRAVGQQAGRDAGDELQQQQAVLLQQQLFEQDGAYDPLSASEATSSTASASTVGGILAARQLAAPVARSVTGSSDLVHVEAYHLVDVQERQVTLNLKALNMTEVDISRVDLQLGLLGAVHFIDSAPHAIRRLENLHPLEPITADFTVAVRRFQRSSLQLHLLFCLPEPKETPSGVPLPANPRMPRVQSHRKPDGSPSDLLKGRRRVPGSGPEGSSLEAVRIRCLPYRLPLTDLLLPYKCSPVEFFRMLPGLPAVGEHTGAYLYEAAEASVALSSDDVGVRRLLAGLRAVDARPLFKVTSHLIRSRAGFQVCYLARTWFGDVLALIVFGTSDIASDGGFGAESATMLCRFLLRSSSPHVVREILAAPQEWLDDLTGGAIRAVSDEELESYSAAKRKRHEEALAILAKNMKQTNVRGGIPLPGMREPEPEDGSAGEAIPVIPEEEHALQLAVLQEWASLKEQQKLEMK